MLKRVLSEQFIITGKLDNVSKVDTRLIKNHILSNFTLDNRIKDDQFWYLHDYINVPYHQHIQWVYDYIRDHYRAEHGRTLVQIPKDPIKALVQQTGENINTHCQINDWNLEGSPEVSCLYCVSTGDKPSHIVFEYDDGRNKHRLWKIPMVQDQFILFSSSLRHYITKNENPDFLVNLSYEFQLI